MPGLPVFMELPPPTCLVSLCSWNYLHLRAWSPCVRRITTTYVLGLPVFMESPPPTYLASLVFMEYRHLRAWPPCVHGITTTYVSGLPVFMEYRHLRAWPPCVHGITTTYVPGFPVFMESPPPTYLASLCSWNHHHLPTCIPSVCGIVTTLPMTLTR